MRRTLKITAYVFLGLFVLLILLTFLIPFFFKDDIKAAIDSGIAKSVNADVKFDANKFSLSIFRNFPNITVSQDDISIVGKDDFKGDTLAVIKSLHITLELWSVIFGSEIKIRGVYLDSPRIFAKVLKNGKANWDIAITAPEDTVAKPEEEPAEFNVSIRRWEVKNAYIVYDDAYYATYTRLENLSHSGSGNFNQDVFDLTTRTFVEKLNLKYDGFSYLEDKLLDLDMVVNMDVPNSKYTFKENKVKINDFSFGFEGFVQMLKDDILMDIKYKAKENKFKNILSLVPGVFTKDFDKLKTEGNLGFGGFVKGTYNAKSMPAFNVDLNVSNGSFQYPSLPASVENINLAMMVNSKDGTVGNTFIKLKNFHMDLDKNPVDAKATVEGIGNSKIDANVKAKINLADLTRMFPMPGLVLRGNYRLDLTVKGNYNEKQMPAVNANMSLVNGYAKSNQYPDAMENISLVTGIQNATGRYEDTKIQVESFKMILDKEAFEATAFFENLHDISYDIKAKGRVDLAKITKIFPQEGMKLAGKIDADLQSKGRMSYIMKSQYDKLPTSGLVKITDFSYLSEAYLPQGFKITAANATFSPQSINLQQLDGFLGKSDIQAKGTLSNYIAYLFQPNAVIKGVMDFNSERFDTNEWMASPTSTPTSDKTDNDKNKSPVPVSSPTESMVVEIPKNIDFTLNSALKEVIYGKMTITNVKGMVTIKDGIIKMDRITFNALGGLFATGGLYNPTDKLHPKYSFDLSIQNLPLSNAYQNFLTTNSKSMLAQNISGDFSSIFKINGELSQSLMPLFDKTMNGEFSMDVLQGAIKDAPILQRLNAISKLGDLKDMVLKDVLVRANIKDGKVLYKPFDVQANDYKMNVSGSNGIDGSLDFLLKLDVPANKLNVVAKTALSALMGKNFNSPENIKLDFKVGGTYLKPEVNLIGMEDKSGKLQEVKEKVKDKVEKLKDIKDEKRKEIKENVAEKAEKIMAAAREQAEKIKAEARQQAEKIKAEADEHEKKSVEEAAKQGPFAKKAAEIAAKKLKEAAYKKADQLVVEADKKADEIVADAQIEADKLK